MLLLFFMFPTLCEVVERGPSSVFGEVNVKVCRGGEGDQLLVVVFIYNFTSNAREPNYNAFQTHVL